MFDYLQFLFRKIPPTTHLTFLAQADTPERDAKCLYFHDKYHDPIINEVCAEIPFAKNHVEDAFEIVLNKLYTARRIVRPEKNHKFRSILIRRTKCWALNLHRSKSRDDMRQANYISRFWFDRQERNRQARQGDEELNWLVFDYVTDPNFANLPGFPVLDLTDRELWLPKALRNHSIRSIAASGHATKKRIEKAHKNVKAYMRRIKEELHATIGYI